MSTYPLVWLNDVATEDPSGQYGLHPEHPPRTTAMPTIQGVSVPGVPGALWTPQGAEGAPLFTVTLLIAGPQAGRDVQFQAGEDIVKMFRAVTARPKVLIKHQTAASGDGSTLYAEARISDFVVEMEPQSLDWRKLTMVFEVPGAFWSDTLPGSVSYTFSQQPTSGTFYTLDTVTADGPLLDGQVRILGPATNPVVRCEESGDWLSYAGTVSAGNYLRVDLTTLRAFVYSSNSWTLTTGEVTNLLNVGTDGLRAPTAFRVLPGFGVSAGVATITGPRLSLTATGITSSTRLEARGRRGYR